MFCAKSLKGITKKEIRNLMESMGHRLDVFIANKEYDTKNQ